MRIALVTGSRKWTDKDRLFRALSKFNPDRIVHGGADGADSLAHKWCKENGRRALVCFPDWAAGGKPALRRNDEMVNLLALYGARAMDVKVFAFPMPDSRGTRYTIRKAQEAGLVVEVFEGKFK